MLVKSYILIIFFISNALLGQEVNYPHSIAQLERQVDSLIDNNILNREHIIDKWIDFYQRSSQAGLLYNSKYQKIRSLYYTNKDDETKTEITKFIEAIPSNTYPAIKAKCLKIYGEIEYENGRYYSSTVSIRSALESARFAADDELIATLQEDLAQVFEKVNRTDRAIQFYQRSFKLYAQLQNKHSAQSCALALGRLFMATYKLDSANLFISQALDLAKELRKKNIEGESLIEKANLCLKMRKYEEVTILILQIDSLLKNEDADFLKVRQYVLKGNYAMLQLHDSVAQYWYRQAETFSRPGFTYFIDNFINTNKADAYFAVGKIEKAYDLVKHINHLNNSYSIRNETEVIDDIYNNSEINIRNKEIELLNIQNQLNRERLEKELLIKRGLLIENNFKTQALSHEKILREVHEKENQFSLAQLDQEKKLNESLKRENELRKEALQNNSHNTKLLWIGIFALGSLLSTIFYLFYKQMGKNKIISRQAEDLANINKEVHHRVKNNLQVISSLLDLQSLSNDAPEIKEILNESKLRVQSMAFIHQNLYEKEGANQVDLSSYMSNLIEHLESAFHKENFNLTITKDIDTITLHMDKAVSLGMIINELLTNSNKYAFRNRENGLIYVSLKKLNHELLLTVSDNGIGISDSIDFHNSNTFGFRMIKAFSKKLKAKVTIENNQGTTVNLLFPQT
ncbi:MAG: hypothetical protein HOP11_10385 [Saprospiraceae bacterium]|nr:hypothetical protein [Saprospiraceae bacterium]